MADAIFAVISLIVIVLGPTPQVRRVGIFCLVYILQDIIIDRIKAFLYTTLTGISSLVKHLSIKSLLPEHMRTLAFPVVVCRVVDIVLGTAVIVLVANSPATPLVTAGIAGLGLIISSTVGTLMRSRLLVRPVPL